MPRVPRLAGFLSPNKFLQLEATAATTYSVLVDDPHDRGQV
jgi:hypothetical protein